MTLKVLQIAIVGAGAMGTLFAARLHDAGHHVTLVEVSAARRAHLNEHGVLLSLAGVTRRRRVVCTTPPELSHGQDMLLLFTKYGALCDALSATCDRLAPHGLVATFANGLGVADMLRDRVGAHPLEIGVTDVAADLRDDRVVSDGSGRVTLGQAQDAATGGRLADALESAGFQVERTDAIAQAVWQKAAFNAGFNALATITNRTVGQLDTLEGHRIVAAVLDEVAAVARHHSIGFDRAAVDARVDRAFREQRHHLSSMLQDRRAGRPTEIEALNGAIAKLAASAGVPAPVNALLADLVRLTGG